MTSPISGGIHMARETVSTSAVANRSAPASSPTTSCARGDALACTDLPVVVIAIAEHRIDGQDSLQIVADRDLVGHSDAAMDLDRAFGNHPAKAANLGLLQRDVARLRAGRLHERGGVAQWRP